MALAKAEVQAEFADALRRAGLQPEGLRRSWMAKSTACQSRATARDGCPGPISAISMNSPPATIHNFKTGEEVRWKAARRYPAPTPAERERLKARVAADQAVRESARRRRGGGGLTDRGADAQIMPGRLRRIPI